MIFLLIALYTKVAKLHYYKRYFISAFVARYSITNDGIQNLLDILKLFLPGDSVLPETTHMFRKFLPIFSQKLLGKSIAHLNKAILEVATPVCSNNIPKPT